MTCCGAITTLGSAVRGPFGRGALVAAGLLFLALCCPKAAPGQAAWEYSPYDVTVWVALEPKPQLPQELISPLSESLASRSESVLGALWSVKTQLAPVAIRDNLLTALENFTVEQLLAADKDCLQGDKLFLAAVSLAPQGMLLTVREVDCRSRQLGEITHRPIASLDELETNLWDLIVSSFTPLVRIERVTEQSMVARLRAGGLIVDPASPGLIEKGMVLRPIVRRNDRSGQPAKTGGISALEWTLLRVDERAASLLTCRMFSGFRGAVPSRPGPRMERLALLVRPQFAGTRVVLESRSDPSKRLAGYNIYTRPPDEPGSGQETAEPGTPTAAVDPVLLGSTDSFGSLELPRDAKGLQILYVKNGRQLLARLPILPGQAEELTAQLADDESRLQAEGFVMALQSRALDLVARRQIVAARLRARLKEGKLDEAQALLEEFRKLETRSDLSRALDEAQQGLVAGDRLTQARMDKLFADARKLLTNQQLSDELLNQLTRELATAKGGGAVASKS